MLMLIKISLILLIIAAVFFIPPATSTLPAPVVLVHHPWQAFALCFIPVFFSYGGYQHTMNFGNDIPNATRTLPRAIFYGISVVLILYLGVNYAYYKILGFDGLAHSTTIVASITQIFAGAGAQRVVSLIMFLSVMAYVNVAAMANPRIYYAMADDKILPPIFKSVNSKTQVQEFSLSLFCVFMLLTLFFLSTFQKILQQVMFFDSISLIFAAATLFILRSKKESSSKGIFKMRGYPVLPALYILVYTLVNIMVFYANPMAALWGLVLFLSGLPLYYLIKYMLHNKNNSHT